MSASIRQRFATTPHGQRSHYARAHGLSRSTLYYKPKKPGQDLWLKERIEEILLKHPDYGYRRIALVLKDRSVNHKRVARVMRLFGLRPRSWKKRKRPRNKDDPATKMPNLRERLSPLAPNIVWAGDFTEFKFRGRKVYLATVIDAWTREIVGWAVSTRHNSELVIDALKDAKRRRGGIVPWIFHSDQGSEYTSNECTFFLASHGIRPSCSPKGKPWKNGQQESWYNTLKKEMDAPGTFRSLDEFWTAINEYICYYNEDRIHGELKQTPRERFQAWSSRAPSIITCTPQNLAF